MNFKSLTAISLVVAMAFGFCACRKLETSGEYEIKEDMFVVDDLGETHDVETKVNEDTGETEFFYTDGLGNVVEVKKSDVGKTTALAKVTTTGANGETEAETYPAEIVDFLEDLTNPDSESEYLEEVDVSLSIADDPINTDSMKDTTPVMNNVGTPAHPTQEEFVSKINSNNQYTVKMTVKSIADGVTTVIPATIMRSGDNIFAEVKWPVDEKNYVTIRVLIKDGRCIMYLPTLRAYIEVPADTVSALTDALDAMTDGSGSSEYQSSGQVTVDGVTYDVDIYETDDGTTMKYYYLKDDLKRVETSSPDGSVMIVEYNSITNTVDKSKFITPTGYFNLGNLQEGDDILNYLG